MSSKPGAAILPSTADSLSYEGETVNIIVLGNRAITV